MSISLPAFRTVVDEFKLGPALSHMKPIWSVVDADENFYSFELGPLLHLTLDVRDRLSGQPMGLHISRSIRLESFRDERDAALWLRFLLRYLLTHELDEAIEFRGERIFDPHDQEKRLDNNYESL